MYVSVSVRTCVCVCVCVKCDPVEQRDGPYAVRTLDGSCKRMASSTCCSSEVSGVNCANHRAVLPTSTPRIVQTVEFRSSKSTSLQAAFMLYSRRGGKSTSLSASSRPAVS
jgi:hypothetical protein